MPRHTNPQSEDAFFGLLADGVFEIDGEGRIWKIKYRRRRQSEVRKRAEKCVRHGYLQVHFIFDRKHRQPLAHRLVFRHFKGPIPEGVEVNHDNGLKDDNRPGNLLLSTSSENKRHADRSGLIDQFGEKNPAAKLTDHQVAQIRLAYSKGGYTMEHLGGRFGVSLKTISKIVRGQRRAKQLGPIMDEDLRHGVCPQDPVTGRFLAPSTTGGG